MLNEIKTGIHSHLCGPCGQMGGKRRHIMSRGAAASDRWPRLVQVDTHTYQHTRTHTLGLCMGGFNTQVLFATKMMPFRRDIWRK